MQKLIVASLLLALIVALQNRAFAGALNCKFKDQGSKVEGIKSLILEEDMLIVNEALAIELSHTRIKCGQWGKQHRFDGVGKGLQVILKTCTDEAVLEGHIIDSENSVAAEVFCDQID